MKGRRLSSAVVAAVIAGTAGVFGCMHTPLAPPTVVQSIVITNPPPGLVLGQTYCFTADVQASNGSDTSVTWSARNGTRYGILSQDGCYRADSVGSDTVTAVSRADTADHASTGFTISAPAPWPPGVLEDLPLATYDGSGQAVHPSEIYLPDGFAGWQYWTAVTPYPFTDARYENPSLFVSSDGRNWTVPPGTSNPLVLPGSPGQQDATAAARYYTGVDDGTLTTLSDPDLVYDAPDLKLRLYFRQVGQAGEQVFLMETADGSTWTAPEAVLSAYPAEGGDLISPSFVRESDRWQAWFVNGSCGAASSKVQTAFSPDGRSGWTAPQRVSIGQPGYVIWHLQVRRIENAYWALYSAYPDLSTECFLGDLFLARSDDGLRWTTFSQPILQRSGAAMFSSGVYRSSMVYDPATGMLVLQLSGYRTLGNRLASATGTMKVDFGQLTGALVPLPGVLARAPERATPRSDFHLPFGDGETRQLLLER